MSTTHTKLARVLHWGVIPLYAYGVFKQLDDVSQLEDTGLLVFESVFASLFLLVVVLRYLYMRRFQTFSHAPAPVSPARTRLARTVHQSMYLCLVVLPLSGLTIAGLYTQGIHDGWMQVLAVGLHEFCADLSYFLIAMHVSAAVLSRIKGEGIWSSMVPVWKEERSDRDGGS